MKPQIQITRHAFKITLPNLNYYREQQSQHRHYGQQIREPKPPYYTGQSSDSSLWSHAIFTHELCVPYHSHALSQREQQILQLFEQKPHIVRKDVEDALQVSQATAILLLREMVEKGLLIKQGSGRQVCYYPGKR